MELNTNELSELATMLSKDRLATLEQELQRVREERDRWRGEAEMLRHQMVMSEMQNALLKKYIILSAEKIKVFVRRLNNIDHWSFLRSFMLWVLPDEYKKEEIDRIDDVMSLPMENHQVITLNQPTFQGPMCDVHGNEEVNLGNS